MPKEMKKGQVAFLTGTHVVNDLYQGAVPALLPFMPASRYPPLSMFPNIRRKVGLCTPKAPRSFDNMRQPISGENKECFTLLLQWGSDDTDTIEFISRAEHHDCGITYYLDKVMFNGKEAKKDGNGRYLLQK